MSSVRRKHILVGPILQPPIVRLQTARSQLLATRNAEHAASVVLGARMVFSAGHRGDRLCGCGDGVGHGVGRRFGRHCESEIWLAEWSPCRLQYGMKWSGRFGAAGPGGPACRLGCTAFLTFGDHDHFYYYLCYTDL